MNASLLAELKKQVNDLQLQMEMQPDVSASLAENAKALKKRPYILAQSGVAIPLTGTLVETTLATITIPAGSLGINGAIRVLSLWSMTNSANSKSARIYFGATAVANVPVVTGGSVQLFNAIRNRGLTNSQVFYQPATQGAFSATGASVSTSAIDTTVDQSLTLKAILTNTGETITLESYTVEIIPTP